MNIQKRFRGLRHFDISVLILCPYSWVSLHFDLLKITNCIIETKNYTGKEHKELFNKTSYESKWQLLRVILTDWSISISLLQNLWRIQLNFLTLLMKSRIILSFDHLSCHWHWYFAKAASSISLAFSYLGREKLGTRMHNFDIML